MSMMMLVMTMMLEVDGWWWMPGGDGRGMLWYISKGITL